MRLENDHEFKEKSWPEHYDSLHLWIKETCLSRDKGTEKETEILTS